MPIEEGAGYTARRARELSFLLEWDLSQLDERLTRVEESLEALAQRYQKELGHTQLILARRKLKDARLPQNLFWAFLRRAKRGEGRDPRSGGKKTWVRIKGKLTDRHIAQYAGDFRNRARYYEFDAERLVLNSAHALLADARQRIQKILRRFRLRTAPTLLAALAAEVAQHSLTPWVRALMVPGLRLVERIVFTENDLRELVEDHQRQPAAPELSLTFSRDNNRTQPRTRWRHREHGWLGCLTDREMRIRWRFPKSLRRAISQWEVPRRRLVCQLVAVTLPFSNVRQIAQSGLFAAMARLLRRARQKPTKQLPKDPPGPPEEGTILSA